MSFMIGHSIQLRVSGIKPETPDTRTIYLEPVDGQPVLYQAGQFLTLLIQYNGHEARRSYSLSSAPDEPLQLTIKRVQNGEISRHLHDTLQVGDILTSLKPAGRFTIDASQQDDIILFGAGSGITPLFAIIKQILRNTLTHRVTLLYSNSTEQTIIFRHELDKLAEKYPHRFRLSYLLSNPAEDWNGLRGRLNNVMLERLLPALIGTSDMETLYFYVCGPADYRRMIQFTLTFKGVRPDQIRQENFVVEPVVLAPPPALAQDRVVLLKFKTRTVDIRIPAYTSILQAALDEGLPLPYSCRGGRCSACAARCLSGRVHMTINDVLTDHDLAAGWVLTCTGYPESDGVIIEIV